MDENTKRKIANNAAASYAFIGWMFLFAKDNKLINNDFVKSHIKSASLIHIGIIITTIVFLVYKFGNIVNIFGIEGNIILATISFLFLGILLFVGAYKAYHFEKFGIGSTIKLGHKKIIEKNNSNFGEKDKLTLVLAHIPFLGYIVASKYDANKEIRNILRVNLVATAFLVFIYVTGYKNLALLFSLVYIIYVTFIGINLFAQSELVNINISRFFSPSEQIKYVKAFIKYLYYYLKGDFKKFYELKQREDERKLKKEEIFKKISSKAPAFAGPKWIIYIPILNLVTFFQRKTNYMMHIRNGLVITFIMILFFLLVFLLKLHYIWGLFLLFPICFGIGSLYKKVYIIPYIFEIYELWARFLSIFRKSKTKLQEKKKEVHEVSYKVGKNNNIEDEAEIQKPIESTNIHPVEIHSTEEQIKK